MSQSFSVERFESCVYGGQHDEAIALLSELTDLFRDQPRTDPLTLMDAPVLWPPPTQIWLQQHFASRMAAAIVSLLGDTNFSLTPERFERLSGCRALMYDMFGAAPLNNADHVARKFLPRIAEDGTVQLPFTDAVKRLNILCNSESRLPLDFSACLRADPVPALNLAMAIACFLAALWRTERVRRFLSGATRLSMR